MVEEKINGITISLIERAVEKNCFIDYGIDKALGIVCLRK